MLLITICDKNRYFVQTLADYMNDKYRDYMKVMAFDNIEIYLKYNLEHDVKVGIIESNIYDQMKNEIEKIQTHIIPLTDYRTMDGIFKYQSVTDIGKNIFNECVELGFIFSANASNRKLDDTTRVYGLYSPFFAPCETIMALSLANVLAKENKVLYLNFHPFSWIKQIFQCEFRQDILDLVFFLSEEQDRFHLRLQGIVDTIENIDYIAPAFSYVDLEETDGKVWSGLLEKLIAEDYDVILLDLPAQMRGLLSLLEKCNQIYISEANDAYQQESYNQFQKMLEYMKEEDILQHISRFPQFSITQFNNIVSVFFNPELNNQARELTNQNDRE